MTNLFKKAYEEYKVAVNNETKNYEWYKKYEKDYALRELIEAYYLKEKNNYEHLVFDLRVYNEKELVNLMKKNGFRRFVIVKPRNMKVFGNLFYGKVEAFEEAGAKELMRFEFCYNIKKDYRSELVIFKI